MTAELTPLHITVPKTARYYMLGAPNELVRDVWIVCHGFSQLAADFIEPFRRFEDDSRLIVAPEALSRFYLDTRPVHRHSGRVGATWMTRADREAEIGDIITYLDTLYERVVETLAERGVARERIRVHALGFSQGSAAVCRWAARGSAVVGHLVVWSGGIPEDVNLRALGERRRDLTVDAVYGTRDRWITAESVEAERSVLEGSGIPYRMRPFNGGHSLSRAVLRELMAASEG